MTERRHPIHSLYEDEPELEDEIDRFVVGLAERVDTLQDAESEADLELVEGLANNLANESGRLGYPDLEEIARGICDACKEAKPDAIQESLLELTEIARRIRLGHRGAAG